ncbi:hypothetical protein Emed_004070 [Eimeria media]
MAPESAVVYLSIKPEERGLKKYSSRKTTSANDLVDSLEAAAAAAAARLVSLSFFLSFFFVRYGMSAAAAAAATAAAAAASTVEEAAAATTREILSFKKKQQQQEEQQQQQQQQDALLSLTSSMRGDGWLSLFRRSKGPLCLSVCCCVLHPVAVVIIAVAAAAALAAAAIITAAAGLTAQQLQVQQRGAPCRSPASVTEAQMARWRTESSSSSSSSRVLLPTLQTACMQQQASIPLLPLVVALYAASHQFPFSGF